MTELQLEYLRQHIVAINDVRFDTVNTANGVELFGSKTDLKNSLKGYFVVRLLDADFKQELVRKFRDLEFKKSKIVDIANEHFISKSDLQSFYDDFLQRSLINDIDREAFVANSVQFIKDNVADVNHFNYTKTSLKKIVDKQYDFIFSNGFPVNIQNINTGVMTANAGDSAQFLFLARAILAGYNCSNVDVRSSRYDAVVDFNNVLLRLQIKGVSSSNSISFKDRDRGGQGIDHTHERNRGQRITANDCDIYVAVDKEVGICYLIPMSYVDLLPENEITSINLSTLGRYKENWNVISDVAAEKAAR